MSFTDDLAFIDPNTIEQAGPKYVMGQWHNGDPKLKAVGGVPYAGGLFVPMKYLSDKLEPPKDWKRAEVTFSSGDTEQGLASTAPTVAVIRTRFCWFVNFNGVSTYLPRSAYKPDSGMRGKLQVLCGVLGFDFPMVFTFTGKASQFFERGLRDWSAKINDAAKRVSNAAYPRFAFYADLQAEPHQKTGQKGQESLITPPKFALPDVVDRDYLSKLYVGRDNLVAWQAEYHKAADWATAWDKGAAEPEVAAPADQPEPESDGYYPDDADLQDIGAVRAPINPVQATFGAGNPPKRPSQYTQGR